MDKETLLHAIMLSELSHVGRTGAARILAINRKRQHGLATFFRLPPVVLSEDYELPAQAIAQLGAGRGELETHCRWLADRLRETDGRSFVLSDHDYPARARERLPSPPVVLYGFGSWEVLEAPTLAVLNSRSVTERTVTASLAVARTAVEQGFTLIGGGMKASHRITAVAARAAAAPRVVVLDRGIFATFGAATDRDPFGFGPGRSALDRARTLVFSPFRLMDHAAAHNGKQRDELIAAFADVIIAVSARPGGVIEHVCLQAIDQGQVVLNWDGENAGLMAAGATSIDEAALTGELRQYLTKRGDRHRDAGIS